MQAVSWNDFEKIELRAGTVIRVEDFPEAKKPAYRIWVDFGPDLGLKKSSARVTALYRKEELLGKQVIAVINFPTKQIGLFVSECLITGFIQADGTVVLAHPERPVPDGSKLA